MKAIHANPKNIKEIFNSSYVIPEFQRRYSWEIDECDKLWNDIVEHFEEVKKDIAMGENYYLGTIVVYKDNSAKYQVIDGQQRLTSLLLLIRALHLVNKTYGTLKECIYEKDEIVGVFTDQIRLESRVIDNDKILLESTIKGIEITNPDSNSNDRFRLNFEFFCKKVNEFSEVEMEGFVKTLLYKLVLLPIECETEDHALTIFERLNDTGKALTDTDIFKSKLYKYYSSADINSANEFVQEWNDIKDHEWLFRVYMHYCRARDGVTESEIALRKFINQEFKSCESAPADTFSFIKKIDMIRNNDSVEVLSLKNSILQRHANVYWNFPIYIWILCNGIFLEDKIEIENSKKVEFLDLLDLLHKFCVVKGITHKTVSAEKNHIYHLCKDIYQRNDKYLERIREQIQLDQQLFLLQLDNSSNIGRYMNLLLLTIASLNPNQKRNEFLSFLKEDKITIEHILPRKWADCSNYWDEESASNNIDRLSNLVMFERRLNIKASNDFFTRKKAIYTTSNCQDVKDLLNYEIWDVKSVNDRHETIKQRLAKWLAE